MNFFYRRSKSKKKNSGGGGVGGEVAGEGGEGASVREFFLLRIQISNIFFLFDVGVRGGGG